MLETPSSLKDLEKALKDVAFQKANLEAYEQKLDAVFEAFKYDPQLYKSAPISWRLTHQAIIKSLACGDERFTIYDYYLCIYKLVKP